MLCVIDQMDTHQCIMGADLRKAINEHPKNLTIRSRALSFPLSITSVDRVEAPASKLEARGDWSNKHLFLNHNLPDGYKTVLHPPRRTLLTPTLFYHQECYWKVGVAPILQKCH
ncbi:hypothetical protein ES288_D11G119100v1 [Gossypium darwinii]|nr:hypothetical protein ES288_D11G119100v1 [Gossypium darwinii]TYH43281.1 hypothetical protein ES332_D11G117000v1 [Gossypium tomentosum]